jgi:methionyl-tRNA formyltransferase
MRLLFLGSGPFGLPTLERLAARGADLVVGTVPDARKGRSGTPEPTPIKARARALGIPVHETASLRGAAGAAFLAVTGGELVIVSDFRLMLGRRFLESAPLGCWNLHGSLLPRHRGAAPIVRAILAGDEEFGVTLTRMVLALDAGPIVDTARCRPGPVDAAELEARLAALAADLLERWLPALARGDAPLAAQDESLATDAPKLEKHEGWIDWSRPAIAIERQVRAMRPWPRAFTEWGDPGRGSGERIFIDRAAVVRESAPAAEPGEIRAVGAGGIHVACGDGAETLAILVLQRAGRRSLPAVEFIRGFDLGGGRFLPPREEQLR